VVEDTVVLKADRHRLRQLLLNLTDNAVKYNREAGYIRYVLERENDHAVMRVESGGRGIPAGELPHIFNRFFRSSASRGSGADGVGLGLSICQWIAHAHGGEITATSVPDHTVLTLRLPLQQPAPLPPAHP
jgi:signal transduction histidine kinase